MLNISEKQQLVDTVKERHTDGLITLLEYLQAAIHEVNNANEVYLETLKDGELSGLELAVAYATALDVLQAIDAELDFHI